MSVVIFHWLSDNRESDLSDKIKQHFFQAVAMLILLYGCTKWMLSKCVEKKLGGNYTRMLQPILNKFWKQHPAKQELYGHLPPISSKANKTCGTLLVKQGQSHMWCSSMDPYTWTYQCWLTNKNLTISALCGHRMQSGGPARSDGW